MLHKVKEIFQKLFPSNQVQPLQVPYKIEPKIEPLSQPTVAEPQSQEVKLEVSVPVVEKPLKVNKPKKPRTNQNGTRSKQRKT